MLDWFDYIKFFMSEKLVLATFLHMKKQNSGEVK